MNTEELHKQIGQTMIDDPENGYKEWEGRWGEDDWFTPDGWAPLLSLASASQRVRRKPRTVTYTVTIPAPYRGEMENGQEYFVPHPCEKRWYHPHVWCQDNCDLRFMERGLVYLTKEDAIAAAKARPGGCDD